MSKIAKVARCIIQEKCVLMGYDSQGNEVFGIGVKPKKPASWLLLGTNSADVRRVVRAYNEWCLEQPTEEVSNV